MPLAPGILCAQGLIVSNLRETFVRTAVTPLADAGMARVADLVGQLTRDADAWFAAEGVEASRRTVDVALDTRYVGQNFELPVAVDPAALPDADEIKRRFFAEHERAYGFHNPNDKVEIVNFRLIAVGRLDHPASRPTPPRAGGAAAAASVRKVWFDFDRPAETPVYDRATLLPGDAIAGPAVIEQLDATTLLFPGDRATVDPHLNLRVEISK